MTCVIAVTAGSAGTGATTVATGLAIALSRHGHSVCLLDADWGSSSASKLLNTQPGMTLVNLLDGQTNLEQVVQQGICGVDIIFGDSAAERMSALTSDQLREMARQLSGLKYYDYLIIDVAAGQDRTVTSFLHASDLLLLVITPNRKTQDSAYHTLKRLRDANATNLMMTVVNQCRNSIIGSHAHARFREITEFYLHEAPDLLGMVSDADRKKNSSQEVLKKLCGVGSELELLAEKILLRKKTSSQQSMREFWQRYLAAADINSDFTDNLEPEGTFESLEEQLDKLSQRVEALINQVNQYKQAKPREQAKINTRRPDIPDTITQSGPEYWLQGLNHLIDIEAGETLDHFYRIQQASGSTLRCAYYRAG